MHNNSCHFFSKTTLNRNYQLFQRFITGKSHSLFKFDAKLMFFNSLASDGWLNRCLKLKLMVCIDSMVLC